MEDEDMVEKLSLLGLVPSLLFANSDYCRTLADGLGTAAMPFGALQVSPRMIALPVHKGKEEEWTKMLQQLSVGEVRVVDAASELSWALPHRQSV